MKVDEKKTYLIPWFTILLTVCICILALRAEVLNYQAGGVMPISYPEDYPGKWRSFPTRPEAVNEYMEYKIRSKYGLEYDMPLTEVQQKEITLLLPAKMKEWKAHNDLKELVGSFGLFLYLLCPIVFFRSIYLLAVKKVNMFEKVLLGCILSVSILSGIHVLYRDYLGSLHW